MKLSKSELKSIIKECILEIFSESFGDSSSSSMNEVRKNKISKLSIASNPKAIHPKPSREPQLNALVEQYAQGDTVMSSILRDTAEKSMQTMISNDHNPDAVGSTTGNPVIEHVKFSPEELFGDEAGDRWSALAFMPNNKRPG